MSLAEYKQAYSETLKQATWCIPLRGEDQVLLAMKKRGFGKGLWNASGGKVQQGETPIVAAAREIEEELCVAVSGLMLVAAIEFYFVATPDWGQKVFGYTTREWTGEATETEEMAPKWFNYSEIPYDQMWADDHIWLPQVLAGKRVEGEFLFGENNTILEYNLRELSDMV